jgi:hypothetical protein
MIQNHHTGTSGKNGTGATFRRQTLIRLTEKSIAEFALELLENLESELEHWTAGINFMKATDSELIYQLGGFLLVGNSS